MGDDAKGFFELLKSSGYICILCCEIETSTTELAINPQLEKEEFRTIAY